jgi:hypothetical protein
MKYELVLSEAQIEEVKKQKLEVEHLGVSKSGGLYVSITIKDGADLLSLFYAGCYYALNKKISV